IKKLGQLIDARPAEKFAYPCRAKIAAARLGYGRSVLENRHRPELEDDKLLRVESGSPLLEYDRTAAIELDGDRGEQKKRGQKQYCRHGPDDVQSSLDRFLESGQWRLLDSHREQQPVRGQTTLPQQGSDVMIRQKPNRKRRLAKAGANCFEKLLAAHGQRHQIFLRAVFTRRREGAVQTAGTSPERRPRVVATATRKTSRKPQYRNRKLALNPSSSSGSPIVTTRRPSRLPVDSRARAALAKTQRAITNKGSSICPRSLSPTVWIMVGGTWPSSNVCSYRSKS